MKIYRLEQEDNIKTRGLYEEVFSEDSSSFVDYYYQEKIKDNTIYVLEEDEQIVSMIHLNPYRIQVAGEILNLHYIVAVATKKEYRKRHYMKFLLERILKDLRDEGESFTYLMPVAEAIYTPYDFRSVTKVEWDFYDENEPLAVGTEVSVLTPVDTEILGQEENRKNQDKYKVFTYKDAAYFNRLIQEYESDGGKLMVYKKADKIIGYKPYVKESTMSDPKIMVRILDVKKVLSHLSLKGLTAVVFDVTDSILEENNKSYIVSGTENSKAMIMEGPGTNSEGSLPIAAFTSFIFGSISVDELKNEKDVVMSERMADEFKKIIPLSPILIDEVV